MPELDGFDARLTAAVRAFADRAEASVDATAVAERAIRGGRQATFAWLGHPLPVPAWIVLATGLLLAALLGATLAGGAWRDTPTSMMPLVSPGPSPAPSAPAAPIAEVDLASVTAHALPPAAACPPGVNPDAPGPQNRAWPPPGTGGAGSAAFDRRSGRIVVVETFSTDDLPQAWSFDVCANTWSRMNRPPSRFSPVLVYDADSDRTIAFVPVVASVSRPVETWSYDLDADRWVRGSDGPDLTTTRPYEPGLSYLKAAYHDPSGLVVAYDGTHLWAYDVDDDRWFVVRQQARIDPQVDVYATTFSYDPRAAALVAHVFMGWDGPQATLTFDPSTREWRRGPGIGRGGPFCSWVQTFGCVAVFDPATGMTLHLSSSIEGWDSGQATWTTLSQVPRDETGVDWCTGAAAYDTLNGRLACLAENGGVAAFTSVGRSWQWLLEPRGQADPVPSAGALVGGRSHTFPPRSTP